MPRIPTRPDKAMLERIVLAPDPSSLGERIDQYVVGEIGGLTRSTVQRLCGEGYVLVEDKAVPKNYRLRPGDTRVEVFLPPPKELAAAPQDISLEIVYEDGALVVVNKPKGMVVHPAAGNADGTLVNALLHHCGGSLSGIGGVARPGIVHRIDKDTSGLLVVAKTDQAHLGLSEQVKAHTFTRRYEAIVYGNIAEEEGRVEAPIGRHPRHRKKMGVVAGGREAATRYRVVRRLEGFTHLALELETGRTHQIRVHMAHIGHPVAGDPLYGPKKVIERLQGQCLHARTLGFTHPICGEYMEFTTGLPEYFIAFLNGHKQA